MRRLWFLVAGLLLVVPFLAGCTPVTTEASISNVSYRLITDSDLGAQARPLLLVLAGHGQSLDNIEDTTNLTGDTLNKGWSIAYLVNDSKNWNSGTCCIPISDTPRTLAVLDDIKARIPVDTHRIYIGGFSNGSAEAIDVLMTYPATFAAGEGVAFPQTRPGQIASMPIRWRHWHATNDGLVPPAGGCVKTIYGVCSGLGTALSTYTEKSRLPVNSTYVLTWTNQNHTWGGVNNADYLNWLAQWTR